MGEFNFQRKSKNKLEPCSYINTSNILYCIGLLLGNVVIFHTSFAGFSEVFYASFIMQLFYLVFDKNIACGFHMKVVFVCTHA